MDELELRLVEKSISGDTEAFQSLIAKHQKKVFNIAYRMMGNEEDAKDMAQEALIKAYKNLENFRMDSSFSTWLYRIATNTCLDELRKKKRKGDEISLSVDKSEDNDMPVKELAVDRKGPETEYLKRERKRVLGEAIRALSEDYKRVIILRDINGFSYEEIADICEMNIGTVKSRINRGRGMLKEKLLEHRELFMLDDV